MSTRYTAQYWDKEHGLRPVEIRRSEMPAGECRYCDENRGGFHPPHDPSPRCDSGKRPHCTCDTCF